jgi:hypothetical protein
MNEWIEVPNKRLLSALVDGARSVDHVTRAQGMHLATWLVKTVVLGNLAAGIAYSLPDLNFVYRIGMPVPSMSVWIGQLADEAVDKPPSEYINPISELDGSLVVPKGWGSYDFHYRLAAILIGQPSDTHRPVQMPVELGSAFARIWPPEYDVIGWPPPIIIDRPTHEALLTMRQFGHPGPGEPQPVRNPLRLPLT